MGSLSDGLDHRIKRVVSGVSASNINKKGSGLRLLKAAGDQQSNFS